MIRDLRKSDAPRVLELLKAGFPEEERLSGTTPEGFHRIVRRVFRWDVQLVLRLLRSFGRPVFRFLVVEEDGRVVATTLLSFPERAGYVSTVTVDAAYRRRGFARALLERAQEVARSAGRKYVVLDVLEQNLPARTLYERIGYRPLATGDFWFYDGAPTGAPPTSAEIRPFRSSDTKRLLEIAGRAVPPDVQEVLPVRASALKGSGFVDRIFESTTAAWVVDRGHGAEAYLGASVGPTAESAYCSEPIVGDGAGADAAAALVRTAVVWCAGHGFPRIITHARTTNERGRAGLLAGGFRAALQSATLYRPVA